MNVSAQERARRAAVDAMNGQYDDVDPALRRALLALCTVVDSEFAAINVKVDRLTKLLVSTTITFVIALATGLLNLIIG